MAKFANGIRTFDLATQYSMAASSNKEAAEKYVGEFSDFINAGDYLPQHVFSCDETGLFLKKSCLIGLTSPKKKNACLDTAMKNKSLF